jgi:DNA-binding transcriptional LysR family regulator
VRVGVIYGIFSQLLSFNDQMSKGKLFHSLLNSLLVFHKVAEHKSLSKAAEELFISQPAVTKHIKELEKKVSMGLIQRKKGKFALTDAGKILFRHTQKISSNLMEIENAFGNLKKVHQGILKIGTTESYSKCLMPKLLSGFQTGFPSIKISLDGRNSDEIKKGILAYKNDLGLIWAEDTSSKFESVPFIREELALIVSPNHPLSQRKVVSLKELVGYPFIIREKGSATRKIVLQAFRNLDIYPSLLIEVDSAEFTKEWVSQGKGISIIVKRIVEEEERRGIIKAIPLLEKLYLPVSILYLKEERDNPAIKAFVNYVKNEGRCLLEN